MARYVRHITLLVVFLLGWGIGYIHNGMDYYYGWYQRTAHEPPRDCPDDNINRRDAYWIWETNDKGEWRFRKLY